MLREFLVGTWYSQILIENLFLQEIIERGIEN